MLLGCADAAEAGVESPGRLRCVWPIELVLAVARFQHFRDETSTCTANLLSCHCLLRLDEPPQMDREHVLIDLSRGLFPCRLGFVQIPLPKTRRRGPRIQHVTIENAILLSFMEAFLETVGFDK